MQRFAVIREYVGLLEASIWFLELKNTNTLFIFHLAVQNEKKEMLLIYDDVHVDATTGEALRQKLTSASGLKKKLNYFIL